MSCNLIIIFFHNHSYLFYILTWGDVSWSPIGLVVPLLSIMFSPLTVCPLLLLLRKTKSTQRKLLLPGVSHMSVHLYYFCCSSPFIDKIEQCTVENVFVGSVSC